MVMFKKVLVGNRGERRHPVKGYLSVADIVNAARAAGAVYPG